MHYIDGLARSDEVNEVRYQTSVQRAELLMETYSEFSPNAKASELLAGWRLHMDLAVQAAKLKQQIVEAENASSLKFLQGVAKSSISLKSAVLTCRAHNSSEEMLREVVALGDEIYKELTKFADVAIADVLQSIVASLTTTAGGSPKGQSWKDGLQVVAQWPEVVRKAAHLLEGPFVVELNQKFRQAEEERARDCDSPHSQSTLMRKGTRF